MTVFGFFEDIKVTDFVKDVGVPVAVAVFGLLGSLFVAALSFALGRWADASAHRRDGYAAAQRTLVAYTEYVWRIRRRTSDDRDELRRLADIGHQLQVDLSYQQTWVQAENRWVGRVYREVRNKLAEELRPATNLAWNTEPVTTAAGMVLGDWGPKDLGRHLERFDRAVAFRFGWRRAAALLRWHPGA